MDKKITLIITGQLRLKENQTVKEKINYHIDYLKPHNTILFFWDYEYQQYQNEIKQLNLQTIIGDSTLPIITEDIIKDMTNALNRQPDTKIPFLYENCDKIFFSKVLKQIFQIQHIYQNINNISDAYIKTRYDNFYLNDFEINSLINNFYNENNPIISTPFGGDYANIGLGDLLTITNNKANKIYQSFYDTYIQELSNNKCPMNAELFLRYIFKNLNHADIYRFHFIMTTERHNQNNLIYHADRNLYQQYGFQKLGEIIGKDNAYLPKH
jgi:hypothetical protein